MLERIIEAVKICKVYNVTPTPETIGFIVWGEVEDPNDFYFLEVVNSYLKKALKYT